jgi:dTDP-4-amino-4,6-dideoxygalactose transaminase
MNPGSEQVPFSLALCVGGEVDAIQEAIDNGHLFADGPFTRRCEEWLEGWSGSQRALLTTSCTAALEMAAMLIEAGPGDEVIMPSYTFSSTANAFALRGATPVFVDIREDTLNLDETRLAEAVTPATKAVVPVHYAGVGCEMDRILEVAAAHELSVIEDAAQGILSTRRGEALGGLGRLGALSFHQTKDVTCGEGGALLVNDEDLVERADILRDKGTNRKQFFRGEVDKYTWTDLGSSYGLSDLNAAFLWVQLQAAERISAMRHQVWDRYHRAFEQLEEGGRLRRPVIPADCRHNAHIYYLLLPDPPARDALLRDLRAQNIHAVFHYVPLHSSPAGRRLGRAQGDLRVTDSVSKRIIRLPLFAGIRDDQVERVIEVVSEGVARRAHPA